MMEEWTKQRYVHSMCIILKVSWITDFLQSLLRSPGNQLSLQRYLKNFWQHVRVCITVITLLLPDFEDISYHFFFLLCLQKWKFTLLRKIFRKWIVLFSSPSEGLLWMGWKCVFDKDQMASKSTKGRLWPLAEQYFIQIVPLPATKQTVSLCHGLLWYNIMNIWTWLAGKNSR